MSCVVRSTFALDFAIVLADWLVLLMGEDTASVLRFTTLLRMAKCDPRQGLSVSAEVLQTVNRSKIVLLPSWTLLTEEKAMLKRDALQHCCQGHTARKCDDFAREIARGVVQHVGLMH
eukprot:4358375-Amphidinium_carterae.1